MKTAFTLFIILFSAFQYLSQTHVEMVTNKNIDSSIKVISFQELNTYYYTSEYSDLRINFETLHDYEIHFDGKNTGLNSNRDIYMKNLEHGDHSFILKKKDSLIIRIISVAPAKNTIPFSELEDKEKKYYVSECPNLKIWFNDTLKDYQIYYDGKNTGQISNSDYKLKLKRGDHTITLVKGKKSISKTIKVKSSPPWFSNDATVFGVLMMVLFMVFRTANSERSYFKKFYKVVPALLLCYFIPAGLNSMGIISSEESNLYFIASRYLLPASLVLLCLSIDIPAIKRLGSKAVIMFFAATAGIILGGPFALWIVSLISPDVLNDEIWRGLSTVAGSWIGGGANQTAMKEIYGASDQMFSAMIVVDVFVANLFMSVLLFGIGFNKKINSFFKADDSAIKNLKTKMQEFQSSVTRVATFNDMIYMLGVTFFMVGLAHFGADYIAPYIKEILKGMPNQNAASLMVSFGNEFFWLVVLATVFGVGLSFTKYRNFEGIGASKMGSVFLYVLVATIGMKMDIMELIANWGVFKFLLSIGLIWIAVHALFLFVVAKIIKAPFFYVAVGSQANVGGAASAPIVAGAFSPSLAPVGVLLAVLGYAVGTFGAIICTLMMKSLAG